MRSTDIWTWRCTVPKVQSVSPVFSANPVVAAPSEHRLEVYIGPKDVDVLEGVGHSLSRAVNLGWFDFIALPSPARCPSPTRLPPPHWKTT